MSHVLPMYTYVHYAYTCIYTIHYVCIYVTKTALALNTFHLQMII